MSSANNVTELNRPLSNTNILSEKKLVSPAELRQRYPRSEAASQTVEKGRAEINAILDHEDKRCLLYTSPSPRDGLLSRMPSSA